MHGTHHVAQKETSTGPFFIVLEREKLSLSIVRIVKSGAVFFSVCAKSIPEKNSSRTEMFIKNMRNRQNTIPSYNL